MFTIRLDESDRRALHMHFLALAGEDRRLRFGFIVSDAVIERYVEGIDFGRDTVFGVNIESRRFDGIAHLALDGQDAELGVSVLQHYRGRGIGTALVSRAIVHARNRQINVLFMQCLRENGPMRRIATSLGMRVVTQGPESEARINLPCADTLSILSEWVNDHVALCDSALRKAPLLHAAVAIRREPSSRHNKLISPV